MKNYKLTVYIRDIEDEDMQTIVESHYLEFADLVKAETISTEELDDAIAASYEHT